MDNDKKQDIEAENNPAELTRLQQNVLHVLKVSLGVVSAACDKAGISRTTFYKWKDNNPLFAEAVSDIMERAIDFAETSLLAQIQEHNTAATIFYLKTKGKGRGYVETNQVQHEVKTVTGFNFLIPENPSDDEGKQADGETNDSSIPGLEIPS